MSAEAAAENDTHENSRTSNNDSDDDDVSYTLARLSSIAISMGHFVGQSPKAWSDAIKCLPLPKVVHCQPAPATRIWKTPCKYEWLFGRWTFNVCLFDLIHRSPAIPERTGQDVQNSILIGLDLKPAHPFTSYKDSNLVNDLRSIVVCCLLLLPVRFCNIVINLH